VPTISVYPTCGNINDYIQISGSGFDAFTDINISFNAVFLKTVTTTAAGNLFTTVQVPSVADGIYNITASVGLLELSAEFTVPCLFVCVEPVDDLYIIGDTVLCPGIYNIDDSGDDGVIIIQSDDVVLDCNGAVLIGSNTGFGIVNTGYHNVTIQNGQLMNYWNGIYLKNVSENTVKNNVVNNNTETGIRLSESTGNTLLSNVVRDNAWYGIRLGNPSDNNTLINSTLNSNDLSGLYVESSWNTIVNNTANNNTFHGFYLDNAHNNYLDNNRAFSNTGDGINLYYSNRNTLVNNIVRENDHGIILEDTVFNTITNNVACANIVDVKGDTDANYANDNLCYESAGWSDEGQEGRCDYACSGCKYIEENTYIDKNTTLCTSTYIFDDADQNGVIIINASDIVLDCNNSQLFGHYYDFSWGYGIVNDGHNNVTITNCNISRYFYGIYVSEANNNRILNNTFFETNWYGIKVINSSDSIIKNNSFGALNATAGVSYDYTDKFTGMMYYKSNQVGINILNSSHSLISNNTLQNNIVGIKIGDDVFGINGGTDNKLIHNLVEGHSLEGISLFNSTHTQICSNIVNSNSEIGILINQSQNTSLYNNTIQNNQIGNEIYKSQNITAFNCSFINNTLGVALFNSHLIQTINSSFYNNTFGMFVSDSTNVSIQHNTFSQNSITINHVNSTNSTINDNDIQQSQEYGISFTNSRDNDITDNTFVHARTIKYNVAGDPVGFIDPIGFNFKDVFSYYNAVENNTVNGDTYYHFVDADDVMINDLHLDAYGVSNIGKISLINSTDITLHNVTCTNNSRGAGLFYYGTIVGNLDKVNTSENKYGIWLVSSHKHVINNSQSESDTYGIWITDGDANNITNFRAIDNYYGIILKNSGDNTLSNVTAQKNNRGVYLNSSRYNTFTHINTEKNNYGIYSFASNHNTFDSLTSADDTNAVYLEFSARNTLSDINISDSRVGLQFNLASSFNTISDCNVINSSLYAIYMSGYSENSFETHLDKTRLYVHGRDFAINDADVPQPPDTRGLLYNLSEKYYFLIENTSKPSGESFLNLTVYYDSLDLDDIKEHTLRLYQYIPSGEYGIYGITDEPTWRLAQHVTSVNTTEHIVNANITSFGGTFALLGVIHPIRVVYHENAIPCIYGEAYYSSIQSAINHSEEDDMIVVCPDLYNENVIVNKSVTVKSFLKHYYFSYMGLPIHLYTTVRTNTSKPVFKIVADYVNISGFEISGNGLSDESSGVYILANNSNISNNILDALTTGIFVYGNNNTISNNDINSNSTGIYIFSENNKVSNNNISADKIGVKISDGIYNKLINNSVFGSEEQGIYLFLSSNNSLIDNIVHHNNRNIMLHNSDNNTLYNNTVLNSTHEDGIFMYYSSGNQINNNTILLNNETGLHLYSSTNNTISNNTISMNILEGIYLYHSSFNTVSSNILSENIKKGIYSEHWSIDNHISDNEITGSAECGICVFSSYDHIIANNKVLENGEHGINIGYDAFNNIIINNTVGGSEAGISLTDIDHSIIYDEEMEFAHITKRTYTYSGPNCPGEIIANGWEDYNDVDNDGFFEVLLSQVINPDTGNITYHYYEPFDDAYSERGCFNTTRLNMPLRYSEDYFYNYYKGGSDASYGRILWHPGKNKVVENYVEGNRIGIFIYRASGDIHNNTIKAGYEQVLEEIDVPPYFQENWDDGTINTSRWAFVDPADDGGHASVSSSGILQIDALNDWDTNLNGIISKEGFSYSKLTLNFSIQNFQIKNGYANILSFYDSGTISPDGGIYGKFYFSLCINKNDELFIKDNFGLYPVGNHIQNKYNTLTILFSYGFTNITVNDKSVQLLEPYPAYHIHFGGQGQQTYFDDLKIYITDTGNIGVVVEDSSVDFRPLPRSWGSYLTWANVDLDRHGIDRYDYWKLSYSDPYGDSLDVITGSSEYGLYPKAYQTEREVFDITVIMNNFIGGFGKAAGVLVNHSLGVRVLNNTIQNNRYGVMIWKPIYDISSTSSYHDDLDYGLCGDYGCSGSWNRGCGNNAMPGACTGDYKFCLINLENEDNALNMFKNRVEGNDFLRDNAIKCPADFINFKFINETGDYETSNYRCQGADYSKVITTQGFDVNCTYVGMGICKFCKEAGHHYSSQFDIKGRTIYTSAVWNKNYYSDYHTREQGCEDRFTGTPPWRIDAYIKPGEPASSYNPEDYPNGQPDGYCDDPYMWIEQFNKKVYSMDHGGIVDNNPRLKPQSSMINWVASLLIIDEDSRILTVQLVDNKGNPLNLPNIEVTFTDITEGNKLVEFPGNTLITQTGSNGIASTSITFVDLGNATIQIEVEGGRRGVVSVPRYIYYQEIIAFGAESYYYFLQGTGFEVPITNIVDWKIFPYPLYIQYIPKTDNDARRYDFTKGDGELKPVEIDGRPTHLSQGTFLYNVDEQPNGEQRPIGPYPITLMVVSDLAPTCEKCTHTGTFFVIIDPGNALSNVSELQATNNNDFGVEYENFNVEGETVLFNHLKKITWDDIVSGFMEDFKEATGLDISKVVDIGKYYGPIVENAQKYSYNLDEWKTESSKLWGKIKPFVTTEEGISEGDYIGRMANYLFNNSDSFIFKILNSDFYKGLDEFLDWFPRFTIPDWFPWIGGKYGPDMNSFYYEKNRSFYSKNGKARVETGGGINISLGKIGKLTFDMRVTEDYGPKSYELTPLHQLYEINVTTDLTLVTWDFGVAKVGIGVTLEGDLYLKYVPVGEDMKFDEGSIRVEIMPYGAFAVDIIIAAVKAKVGGGVEFKLSFGKGKETELDEFKIFIQVQIDYRIVVVTEHWGQRWIYDWISDEWYSEDASKPPGWRLIERDYINEGYAEYVAPLGIGHSSPTTEQLLIRNIFPDADPQLAIDNNDQKMIVYVHDEPEKNLTQAFEIYYMQGADESWTEPQPITQNTILDVKPAVIFDSNNDAMATWVTVTSNEFPDNISVNDITPYCEIAYAIFNSSDNTWSQPMALTNDSMFDYTPHLVANDQGEIMAMWVTDRDSIIHVGTMIQGNHSLLRDFRYAIWNGTNWTSPIASFTNISLVNNLDFDFDNQTAIVTWGQDGDDNATTHTDREIYYATYNGSWSNPIKITHNTLEDKLPTATYYDNTTLLLWVTVNEINNSLQNTLYYTIYENGTWSESVPITCTGQIDALYLIKNSYGNPVVIWQESSHSANIFYSVYDTTTHTWSKANQLTDDLMDNIAFSPAITATNDIISTYLKREINYVNHTTHINNTGNNTTKQNISIGYPANYSYNMSVPTFGNTSLYLLSHHIFTDLAISDNDIYFSTSNPQPGETVTLYADIHNTGDVSIHDIDILLTRNYPGTPIGTMQHITSIAAGDTQTVAVNWTVPNTNTSHEIYVELDPLNYITEENETNNIASTTVVFPDLTVTAINTNSNYDHISINTSITNKGWIPATNVTVDFYYRNLTSDIKTHITRETLTYLTNNSNQYIEILWNVIQLDADYYYLYVVLDEENIITESDETNNHEYTIVNVFSDLLVQTMNLSSTIQGDIMYQLTLANNGNYNISNVTVHAFATLNKNGDLTETTTLINTTLPFIEKNAQVTITQPWTPEPGNYILTAYIDPEDTISETNEFNNYATTTTTILQQLDFISFVEFDIDADGLYDYLSAQINITITDPGTYYLQGELECGDSLLHVSTLDHITLGIHTLKLNFSGAQINEKGTDGPYTLKNVTLFNTYEPIGILLGEYQTDDYSANDFETLPLQLTGIYSDYGLDNDNNGVYDYLRLLVDISVSNSGYYYVEGSLYDSNRSHVASVVIQTSLETGIQNVILDFDGDTILHQEKNGPYHLAYLTIYDEQWHIIAYEEDAYITQTYSYSDFQDYVEAEAHVFFNPRHKMTAVNTSSMIDVDISTDKDICAVSFEISYNPSKIQVTNISPFDFVTTYKLNKYSLNTTINITSGKATFNFSWCTNDTLSPFFIDSIFSIATINFNSSSLGHTTMALENITVLNSSHADIYTATSDCIIEIFNASTLDLDEDGIPNDIDNCMFLYNPGQADSDGNRLGDACNNHPPAIPSPPTGPLSGYINIPYTYTFRTIDHEHNLIKYCIDWDDGTTTWTPFADSLQNTSFSHMWTIPGTYFIKIKAQDEYSMESLWSYVTPILIASNTAPNMPLMPSGLTSGYTGTSYSYTTSTTDFENHQIKYYVDWDDGTGEWTDFVDSGETVSLFHIWNTPGTYNVRVKAQDERGMESDWSQAKTVTITTYTPPVPTNIQPTCSLSGQPTNGNIPLIVTFTLTASDTDGTISSWSLDVDDDGTPEFSGSGTPPVTQTHTYNTAGSFNARLTVTDDDEATSTDSQTIIVNELPNQLPTASFSYTPTSPVKKEETITFTDSSTDADGSTVNWTWDFDDGNSSYSQHPTHTYIQTGTYTITLTVADNDNDTDSYTLSIEVEKKKDGTPGFVLVFMIGAIMVMLLIKRRKHTH